MTAPVPRTREEIDAALRIVEETLPFLASRVDRLGERLERLAGRVDIARRPASKTSRRLEELEDRIEALEAEPADPPPNG